MTSCQSSDPVIRLAVNSIKFSFLSS